MGEKSKYVASDNAAKNFGFILKDINKIAIERELPVQEVIRMLIKDLENADKEGYEREISEISITLAKDISKTFFKNLIDYLNEAIKRHDKMEKERQKKEDRVQRRKVKANEKKKNEDIWTVIESEINANDTVSKLEAINKIISYINNGEAYTNLNAEQRKYILQKLIAKAEQEEEKQATKEKRVNKAWEKIVQTVERAAKKNNIPKLRFWEHIKKEIGKEGEGIKLNLEIPEAIKDEIMSLIDGKIEEEKDLIYYEQVKYFTKNFSFLREYPEVVMGTSGRFNRKFTDFQSHERYYSLVDRVRDGYDEYYTISTILEDDKLNAMDRKILNERMSVLEHERAKKGEGR